MKKMTTRMRIRMLMTKLMGMSISMLSWMRILTRMKRTKMTIMMTRLTMLLKTPKRMLTKMRMWMRTRRRRRTMKSMRTMKLRRTAMRM